MKRMTALPLPKGLYYELPFHINDVEIALEFGFATIPGNGVIDALYDKKLQLRINFDDKAINRQEVIQEFVQRMANRGVTIDTPDTLIELSCNPQQSITNFNAAAEVLFEMERESAAQHVILERLQPSRNPEQARKNIVEKIMLKLMDLSGDHAPPLLSIADLKQMEKEVAALIDYVNGSMQEAQYYSGDKKAKMRNTLNEYVTREAKAIVTMVDMPDDTPKAAAAIIASNILASIGQEYAHRRA